MNEPDMYKPLTDAELDRLSEFLDSLPDSAMTLEKLDGFFVALICGPEAVPPSEYLPLVWGENFEFKSNESALDMLTLMMRHWNMIADVLSHARVDHDVYEAILHEDEEGIASAHDWADGFMLGVAMRRESWNPLFEDEENRGLLVPMLVLHHERQPDLEDELSKVTHEQRETAIQYMIGSVVSIYQYFAPLRRTGAGRANIPLRRDGPKVGRNEPCPCGSGRKYKHCCGKDASTLH